MRLDRVTFTGADDSILPTELVPLSRRYPFAEWGILVSARQVHTPRFPSYRWMAALRDVAAIEKMNLSLHVCGRWVRQLLLGEFAIPEELLAGFSRVQLNFHGELNAIDFGGFREAIRKFGDREIIFQVDGVNGEGLLMDVWSHDNEGEVKAIPLHDVSHGAGISPPEWPLPLGADVWNGYAGGIGPENLLMEIARIGMIAKGSRVWIDMETKVRRKDPHSSVASRFDIFDLAKVETVCRLVEPFVEREPAPNVATGAPWPFPERA